MVEPRPYHILIILNKHPAPPWLSNHEHFLFSYSLLRWSSLFLPSPLAQAKNVFRLKQSRLFTNSRVIDKLSAPRHL